MSEELFIQLQVNFFTFSLNLFLEEDNLQGFIKLLPLFNYESCQNKNNRGIKWCSPIFSPMCIVLTKDVA